MLADPISLPKTGTGEIERLVPRISSQAIYPNPKPLVCELYCLISLLRGYFYANSPYSLFHKYIIHPSALRIRN